MTYTQAELDIIRYWINWAQMGLGTITEAISLAKRDIKTHRE